MQLKMLFLLPRHFCILPPLPLSSPTSSSSSSSVCSSFQLLFKRYCPLTPSFSSELIQRVRQQQPFRSRHLDMAPANVEACTDSRRHAKTTKKKQTLNDYATQQMAVDVAVQSIDAKEGAPRPKGLGVLLEELLTLEKAQKLASLSVVELRNILRQVDLNSTGRKPDLVHALKGFLACHQSFLPSVEIEKTEAFRADHYPSEGKLVRGKRSAIVKGGKNIHSLFDKPYDNSVEYATLMNGNYSPEEEDKQSPSRPEDQYSADVIATISPLSNSKRKKKAKNHTEHQNFERLSENKCLKTELVEVSADVHLKINVDYLDKALKQQKPWSVLVHKKPRPEWVSYDPTSMRPVFSGGDKTMKLISWNVNGLRALLKVRDEKQEDATLISQLAESENFDVLCLQETKLQEKDVEQIRNSFSNHYGDSFWSCSITKLGYSGSALISRKKPLSIVYGLGLLNHDGEGRVITAEFESFFLVSAYVPNSGAKLERLVYRTTEWDPALSCYLKELEKRKPVVLTGDLNCAYDEIDIHDPNGNHRSAGFTDEERSSFESHLLGQGLLDTFRRQHPNAVAYTYWGYRSGARPQNKGWRLDYFLVSSSLADHVHDSYTSPHIGGSDHCPIGLILKI